MTTIRLIILGDIQKIIKKKNKEVLIGLKTSKTQYMDLINKKNIEFNELKSKIKRTQEYTGESLMTPSEHNELAQLESDINKVSNNIKYVNDQIENFNKKIKIDIPFDEKLVDDYNLSSDNPLTSLSIYDAYSTLYNWKVALILGLFLAASVLVTGYAIYKRFYRRRMVL